MYKIVNPNLEYTTGTVTGKLPEEGDVLQSMNTEMMILDTSDMSLEKMDFESVLKVYKAYPNLCDFKLLPGAGFITRRKFQQQITINGVEHKFARIQDIAVDVSKFGRRKLFKPVEQWVYCYHYKFRGFVIVRGLLVGKTLDKVPRVECTPFDVFYNVDGSVYGWRCKRVPSLTANNRLSLGFSTPDNFGGCITSDKQSINRRY